MDTVRPAEPVGRGLLSPGHAHHNGPSLWHSREVFPDRQPGLEGRLQLSRSAGAHLGVGGVPIQGSGRLHGRVRPVVAVPLNTRRDCANDDILATLNRQAQRVPGKPFVGGTRR